MGGGRYMHVGLWFLCVQWVLAGAAQVRGRVWCDYLIYLPWHQGMFPCCCMGRGLILWDLLNRNKQGITDFPWKVWGQVGVGNRNECSISNFVLCHMGTILWVAPMAPSQNSECAQWSNMAGYPCSTIYCKCIASYLKDSGHRPMTHICIYDNIHAYMLRSLSRWGCWGLTSIMLLQPYEHIFKEQRKRQTIQGRQKILASDLQWPWSGVIEMKYLSIPWQARNDSWTTSLTV